MKKSLFTVAAVAACGAVLIGSEFIGNSKSATNAVTDRLRENESMRHCLSAAELKGTTIPYTYDLVFSDTIKLDDIKQQGDHTLVTGHSEFKGPNQAGPINLSVAISYPAPVCQ